VGSSLATLNVKTQSRRPIPQPYGLSGERDCDGPQPEHTNLPVVAPGICRQHLYIVRERRRQENKEKNSGRRKIDLFRYRNGAAACDSDCRERALRAQTRRFFRGGDNRWINTAWGTAVAGGDRTSCSVAVMCAPRIGDRHHHSELTITDDRRELSAGRGVRITERFCVAPES